MNEDTADSNGRKLRRYKLYNSDHYKTKTIFFLLSPGCSRVKHSHGSCQLQR